MEQIAIYLRLSKEDEFVKDESNSITNQRAFIRGFINKNKELRKMSVMEFVDDGYSGKNMDRPDMQRMLELVKRKQISCVIVKDFSRFSILIMVLLSMAASRQLELGIPWEEVSSFLDRYFNSKEDR